MVPDFQGQQALDAWLKGHDMGLLLQGPDPDSHPLLNGVVVAQSPAAGTQLGRWDTVTVWVSGGGDPAGVREPLRPLPNHLTEAEAADEPSGD
jgi:beta-lactam-binding protein with PASTA domain